MSHKSSMSQGCPSRFSMPAATISRRNATPLDSEYAPVPPLVLSRMSRARLRTSAGNSVSASFESSMSGKSHSARTCR